MFLRKENNKMIIVNPADYSLLSRVSITSSDELKKCVKCARAILPMWKRNSVRQRVGYLRIFLNELLENRNSIVDLIIRETGKTKIEAKQEFGDTIHSLRYHLTHAEHFLDYELTHLDQRINCDVIKEPWGVVSIITPSSTALLELEIALIPCLLCGNVVVYKPPENALLLCQFVSEMLKKILPAGVLEIVYGDGEVGALMPDEEFDFYYYVGAVRLEYYQKVSNKFSDSLLQMGGSSPAILFEDTEVTDELINEICYNRFRNCGQTCNCIKRLLVHVSLYKEVVNRIFRYVQKIQIGNPAETDTQMGCLGTKTFLDILKLQVEDALQKGAQLEFCGRDYYDNSNSNFFPPIIILNTTSDMLVRREQTFGPLLPIVPFINEAEAITIANETEYGLTAYIFTKDAARKERVCDSLQCARIQFNTIDMGSSSKALDIPFGGRKLSGKGYQNGKYIFDEFTQYKVIIDKELN